jgi:hypothetical protein
MSNPGEFRRAASLIAQPGPRTATIGAVIGERSHDHAGVDDDQRPSRSARTALTDFDRDARPPARQPARSSDEPDALCERAVAAGATLVRPLKDEDYGSRASA